MDVVVGCLFEFDPSVGPTLVWMHPEVSDVRKVCEEQLPFLCLPENTSSIVETASAEATLLVCKSEGKQRAYFGASVMMSERSTNAPRRSRQQAVCVLCAYPAFDVLETRARSLASVCFGGGSGEGRDVVLDSLRSRCTNPSFLGDYAACISSKTLVRDVGADSFVRCLRVAVAGGRIAFFSREPARASRAVLALAASIPALVSKGLTPLTIDDCPLLGSNDFRWAKHNFPLPLNTLWAPAVSMATAGDLLLGAHPPESFAIGTCNAMLARRLADAAAERRVDCVVDLDDRIVEPGASPLFKASLDPESAKLLDDLKQQITEIKQENEHGDDMDWFGSDAWLRARTESWLVKVLLPTNDSFSSRGKGWLAALEDSLAVSKWRREREVASSSSSPQEESEDEEVVATDGEYQGERDEAGRRHGRGTVRFGGGGGENWYYRGEWVRGSRHGYGEARRDDRRYVGEWRDDLEHGRGELTWNGGKYEGEFVRSFMHGSGNLTTTTKTGDTTTYSGEFVRGLYQGAGKLKCPSYSYVGEWKEGKRHGTGHTVFSDGKVMAGTWDADVMVEGTSSVVGGDVAVGTFDGAGQLHGDGALTTADGDVFEGVFDHGEMSDDATWTVRYSDGRRYAGSLRDGVPSGRGVCRYANGDVYEGEFKDGLRSGIGSFLSHKGGGETLEGHWRCDSFFQVLQSSHSSSSSGGSSRTSAFLLEKEDTKDEAPQDDDDDETPLRPGRVSRKNDDTVLVSSEQPRADEVERAPWYGSARVRYPNGDVYEGSFERGRREGQGVFTEAVSGHCYDGGWVKGQRHGHGTFTSGDGDFVYDGDFRSGKREGRGVARIRGSCSYAGLWRQDVFHGQGVLVDARKNVYEGEFRDGVKDGVGTQRYAADDSKYVGEWREGVRSGTGHFDDGAGVTYTGSWLNDRPHGHGQLCDTATGAALFDGCFSAGVKHGWGVEKGVDGTSKEGEWVRGKPQLDVDWTLFSRDGSKYVGPVTESRDENDPQSALKPHGKGGVVKYANGDTYSGSFVDGKRAGSGLAVFKNGEMFDGDWHDDHISLNGNGTLTLPDGTIHTFSNNTSK